MDFFKMFLLFSVVNAIIKPSYCDLRKHLMFYPNLFYIIRDMVISLKCSMHLCYCLIFIVWIPLCKYSY